MGSPGSTGEVYGMHGLRAMESFECAVLRQGMLRNPAEEDIRASILRHADKEGDQFSTFTKAYAKTQPERIFAASCHSSAVHATCLSCTFLSFAGLQRQLKPLLNNCPAPSGQIQTVQTQL